VSEIKHHHFEWDSEKATSNVHKHGVSFEEAATVFEDSFFIAFRSQRLAVAFTEPERIRIISARKLTSRERRNYEKKKKNSQPNDDPLAGELDFEDLEVVALGPGWKKPAPSLRSLKRIRTDNSKRESKSSPKRASNRRAA